MKFNSFYKQSPVPVTCVPDTETKWVDQSEADRCSLKYQLERYGMDTLMQQLEKTKAQFGYADTRATKDFAQLAQYYADANGYFQELPSEIRKQFGHSAVEFYSAIEKQPKDMYEKGYISKEYAKSLGVKFDEVKEPVQEVVEPVIEVPVQEKEVSA